MSEMLVRFKVKAGRKKSQEYGPKCRQISELFVNIQISKRFPLQKQNVHACSKFCVHRSYNFRSFYSKQVAYSFVINKCLNASASSQEVFLFK